MAKVNLDVPESLHLEVKRMQLDKESRGEKVNLREVYYEIIRQGLKSLGIQIKE